MAQRLQFWTILGLSLCTAIAACAEQTADPQASTAEAAQASPGPRTVAVIGNEESGFSFTVDGDPYTVHGAGLGQPSRQRFEALVAAGGNTMRTWSASEADLILELAAEYDVMVALGIDLDKELHGFDYNDEAAVAAQFERAREEVDRYKDHPNLLVWLVGNELNLLFDENGDLALVNPKAFEAVNDIAAYIKQVDPHHPVSTTFAGYHTDHIVHAMPHLSNIDILSVQLYGDLVRMPEFITNDPSGLPVMLTEYGPIGHWEMPSTEWGREIEETSANKAAGMAARIDEFIVNEPTGKLLATYAFYWGHKQERTSTWYSLFTEDGQSDARIDELSRHWTGSYPANRAPLTESLTIDGQAAVESIRLQAGQTYTAALDVSDPEDDPLTTEWTFRTEVIDRSDGGAFEVQPGLVDLEILSQSTTQLVFRAPTEPGEYRLFALTTDPGNKVGTANIPVLVQ